MNIYTSIKKINESTYEYRGINLLDNSTLFKNTLQEQIGIVEFISCVHALMYIKKQNINADVYIDNEYIQKCVQTKKYKHNAKSEHGRELLRRCKMFLIDTKKTIIIYIRTT